jgi:nuclear transport factor 2 (NTF2) superfamily protein
MRPPLPPFTNETALAKVQAAEDGWNTQDPEKVALAYTENTRWRNRSTFLDGRDAVRQFLQGKWQRELDYRLKKTLWSFTDSRIAVKFEYEYEYEYHNADDQWFRAHGNELWEFAPDGLMQNREASINEQTIDKSERKFRWEQ